MSSPSTAKAQPVSQHIQTPHDRINPSTQSSNWLQQRKAYLQSEIEGFLKDRELLRQLELNELSREAKGTLMLKEELKRKGERVREWISEL